MHIEDATNADATIFNDTMRALGLEQHILGPTLRSDHHTAKQQLQHH